MQFHRAFAGVILATLVAVPPVFGAGSVAAEPVRIAFPQNQPPPRDAESGPVARVHFLTVDFAGILQIEGGMNTIAVGNPDIVDAKLANHRAVILTGRMVGTTNLIALDEAGRILADVLVHVGAQKPGMVTVRRGTQLQTYNCTIGLCDGDGNDTSEGMPLADGSGG